MNRNIAIVGAPTSIGIRTYDSGEPRHLDRAPGVLRELGLEQRLRASDLGDVIPLPYRDFIRPAGRARNEAEVGAYCRALGERVEEATSDGRFAVVMGGDCSIVLGSLLGARKSAQGSVGLVYVDAHADFGTPEESHTGSVASMCLALAVGRGEIPQTQRAGAVVFPRPHQRVLELRLGGESSRNPRIDRIAGTLVGTNPKIVGGTFAFIRSNDRAHSLGRGAHGCARR